MKKKFIFILIIFVALAFRLPGLSFRTMHGDEAVNAIKFSQLLEHGEYEYNPTEYHGPSLYYFTLPVTLLALQNTLTELSEATLRIIPVIFFLGLLIILLLIKNRVGWNITFFSSLLLAVSPIFVYYSRYFIHEMLFVFFSYATIFSALKLFDKPGKKWAGLFGTFFALMIATKETWIILFSSAILTMILLLVIYPEFRESTFKRIAKFSVNVYSTFVISFAIVYTLMFTSFFQNFSGLWDSIVAITGYLDKANSSSVHVHPWYQYFKWLMLSSNGSYFWSEIVIGIFGITGIVAVFTRKHTTPSNSLFFIRFIALFSFILMLIFSVILYKTPWNALSFWMGMIILAGFGFCSILEILKDKLYKKLFTAFVALAILQLAWQSYQINFIEFENPANPYVYAQPQKDIFRILEPLNRLAEKHPDKKDMYIQVIVKDDDYWPLPWYLRDFSKVGWWNKVDMDVSSAGFIIASPEMEADLVWKFYEITEPGKRDLYVPLLPDYVLLRPGSNLRVFVSLKTRDLLN